jgi:hypothetical protein
MHSNIGLFLHQNSNAALVAYNCAELPDLTWKLCERERKLSLGAK